MSDVTTKDYDWAELVKAQEGDRYYEEDVVYEFNGGTRIFTELRDHKIEAPE
jgi:hypothetical protein